MRNGRPHQTEKTSPVARIRPWLITSAAAICWGLLTIVVLHLSSSRNPVLDTLSSYVITDRGTGMLALGLLSVALGSLAILGALDAARIPLGRTTKILFGCWSGGLILAATFPANYRGSANPFSGEIHQYSSLLAFLSLPAIGWSLLDRLRSVRALARPRATLARWTRYSLAALLLFGLSYLLAKYSTTPVLADLADVLPVGLTQRIAIIVDIGLLCSVLAVAIRAATNHRVIAAA